MAKYIFPGAAPISSVLGRDDIDDLRFQGGRQ
jgi:hypothetical protein